MSWSFSSSLHSGTSFCCGAWQMQAQGVVGRAWKPYTMGLEMVGTLELGHV